MGNYNPFYKASELVAINIHLRRTQKWYVANSEAHNTDKSVYDSIK
jgi:hypothetical protein